MSLDAIAAEARAAGAIFRRDLLTTVSYRSAFVSTLVSMCLGLVLFHFLAQLVRVESFASAQEYYAYVVVGMVILQVLNSTFMAVPGAVGHELVAGTFERVVLSPFGPVRALLASTIFPLLWSLVIGCGMLAFTAVAFGVDVRWSMLPVALPVAALAALSFAPFGLVSAATVLVFKHAMSGMTWIVAIMAIVAGLYFPIALLPGWLRWASEVQPFTPAVELLRNLFVGTPMEHSPWVDLLKICAFCAALLPLSLLAIRQAVLITARRGTISEY